MKSEIDALLLSRNMDAILVFGNAENNPPMTYLTGGGHVSAATLIKKRDEDAVIFCNLMERDEAGKSGLKVRLYDEYPWQDYLNMANGDIGLMVAIRLKNILLDMDIKGRIGIYGHTDISSLFGIISHFQKIMPEVELIGESRENSLFMYAMETKEEAEIARIRKVGAITTEVVGLTREFLTNCEVNSDEILLNANGSLLKLGEVKSKINLWLAERGVVPSEGYIFSIGRDAGVPHSQGNPTDLLCLGKTIVFDIYPQEAGGGYYYDFTRTWSLGYATPEAQTLFDQVLTAYTKVVEKLRINGQFKDSQSITCDVFEGFGHATPRTQKAPAEGYIHSIGHGVGLNIHERPWSGLTSGDDNLLKAGVVMTIEPGLYYPDKNMGFRIEDTFWVKPDGVVEKLAEFSYDFVLPMKKWRTGN